MICQFSVKNYKCIKNEITFDMQAANITEHEDSLLVDNDGEKFLPLGVIYGPNGAGKSTILHALYSLICKLMRPICAVGCDNEECIKHSGNVNIVPFKFSEETFNLPTEYELFFRTNEYEYQYILKILKTKILYEELSRKKISGSKYFLIFKRENNNRITLMGPLKDYKYDDISDNLPLISFLGITHRKNAIIRDIIDWFEDGIDFINYGLPSEDARIMVTDSNNTKNMILKIMQEMDINISDYRIENKDDDIEIYTTHNVNEKDYELEIVDESNGTIKVFGMLPHIAKSILTGNTLIIDELDAKLHPQLLKYIINLFSNKDINKHGAQLIFTSHDLSTMNSQNFRRDEIWFVAKDDNSSSKLYSLIEFKHEDGKSERKDARYDKRYLEGKYGADPYFRRIIDWGEY